MFDICASPKICCKGFGCSECLFGENAAQITDVSCCAYLLLRPILACGLIHMTIRAKIGGRYCLEEEPSDVVAARLLSPFAVCQEACEIISREKLPSEKVRRNQPINNIIPTADSEVASSNDAPQAS